MGSYREEDEAAANNGVREEREAGAVPWVALVFGRTEEQRLVPLVRAYYLIILQSCWRLSTRSDLMVMSLRVVGPRLPRSRLFGVDLVMS